jgi:hypothetical protein
MRRLPHDVQRDLHFFRTAMAFRNAIERMQVARGTVDPDDVSWWWGFGYLGRPRSEGGTSGFQEPDDVDPWGDDDDLAGSRVPRRPFGGAGAAGAEAEPVGDIALDDLDGASLSRS